MKEMDNCKSGCLDCTNTCVKAKGRCANYSFTTKNPFDVGIAKPIDDNNYSI